MISTHAPAGGATARAKLPPELGRLFLLTPLREGRRRAALKSRIGDVHFYSRPCGRGDSRYFEADAEEVTISTHAPAGGATNTGAMGARK